MVFAASSTSEELLQFAGSSAPIAATVGRHGFYFTFGLRTEDFGQGGIKN